MASSYGPTEWTRPGSRRGGRETRSGSSRSATCWNATWPATSSAARTCDPRRRPSWPGRLRASPHRPGRPAPRRLLASRRPRNPDSWLALDLVTTLHVVFTFVGDGRGGPEPRAALGFRAHEPLGCSLVGTGDEWRRHEPERSEWFMVG